MPNTEKEILKNKIKDLEILIKTMNRRILFLEKENTRRKRDVEEVKRNVK